LRFSFWRFFSLDFMAVFLSAWLSWLSSVWEFSCPTKVRNDRNNPAGESAVASHDLIEAHSRSQGCLVAHARFNDRPPPSSGNPLSGKLSGQLLVGYSENPYLVFSGRCFQTTLTYNSRTLAINNSRYRANRLPWKFHRIMVGGT